jgi:uncharacterized protein YecE (DUF72 family)
MPHQPSLFPGDDASPPGPRDDAAEALAERFERLRPIAAALPPGVRFGTSSWSFPGWKGLVYSGKRTAAQLSRDGLREYARHPLLTTVGVDRSYYAPVPDEDFRRYADQLPEGFPCCCKAPARVTSPLMPERRSAEPNPDFLSADRLIDDLLEPVGRVFRPHAGPFVLQFPPLLRTSTRNSGHDRVRARVACGARSARSPEGTSPPPRLCIEGLQRSGLDRAVFIDGLDRFLGRLPRDFQYAVEVRDSALLGPDYAQVLSRHGAAHVYNAWTAMPLPGEQTAHMPLDAMPFLMVRLLLRPGATYEERREAFAPFDRLVAPDEQMRDQVVDLVGRAVARAIPAYVLVNNKAEGSSPLTIEALAERLSALGSWPSAPSHKPV